MNTLPALTLTDSGEVLDMDTGAIIPADDPAAVPEDAPERRLTRLSLRWDEYFSVMFAGADGFSMVDTRFLAPLSDPDDIRWRWRQAVKDGPIVGAFRGEDTVILMPMGHANGPNEGESLWGAWKGMQRPAAPGGEA